MPSLITLPRKTAVSLPVYRKEGVRIEYPKRH